MIEQNVTKFVRSSIEKIRQKAFYVDNEKIYLKASAGIVLYPKDSDDINAIVNYAQAACRKAKHLGKNQCVFFNESIYEEFINDYRLLNEIARAIEFEEFELYFQPIYNTRTHSITNAEALIRWNHPSKGLLAPYYFMPTAEKNEIIEKLDFYVLEKAFQAINKLKSEGLRIVLSVNQTARTFLLDSFTDEFKKLMDKYNIEPDLIKIELTESIALSDEQKAKRNMQTLNNLGVKFSMDDFGTGYSSILTLKKFPFSNIKIDQNFVMDSQHNKDSLIISYNLLHMLNQLKFETTVEGVENEYLFFVFSHLPSDLLQGYFISKPIAYKEFLEFSKNFAPDDLMINLTSNKSKMLDLDAIEAKFYIYKYYKILKENIKGKLTDNNIEDLSSMIELDYKHCDFGKWYYSLYPKYGSMESFKRIEQLHIDIHKTTEKILSEKNKENIETLFGNLKEKIIQLNDAFESFFI